LQEKLGDINSSFIFSFPLHLKFKPLYLLKCGMLLSSSSSSLSSSLLLSVLFNIRMMHEEFHSMLSNKPTRNIKNRTFKDILTTRADIKFPTKYWNILLF